MVESITKPVINFIIMCCYGNWVNLRCEWSTPLPTRVTYAQSFNTIHFYNTQSEGTDA